MKNLTLLVILNFTTSINFAQNNEDSWKLYADNTVARIDIYIDSLLLAMMKRSRVICILILH